MNVQRSKAERHIAVLYLHGVVAMLGMAVLLVDVLVRWLSGRLAWFQGRIWWEQLPLVVATVLAPLVLVWWAYGFLRITAAVLGYGWGRECKIVPEHGQFSSWHGFLIGPLFILIAPCALVPLLDPRCGFWTYTASIATTAFFVSFGVSILMCARDAHLIKKHSGERKSRE